jgi:hypothetical protein
MTETTRRPLRSAVIVAALVAAAALRARAVHQLPPDFDEFDYIPIGYLYAERMTPGRWGEIPEVRRNAEHPALVKLLHGVALKVTGAPEPDFSKLGVGRPLGEDARPAFTATRSLSAVAGSLQVLLVALVSPVGGLWLAADTYHTKYSAEAMLEAIPGLFALMAVLLFERATRPRAPEGPRDPARTSVPLLMASAVTLGLSAAGKYPYPLVVGLALLPFLVARLRSRPALLASYFAAALAVFVMADPMLWPDPLGRLTDSLAYHWRYQSSEHVVKSALPWWWQFHWLTRPEPATWHPGVFPVPWLDYAILAGGLLGVTETLRRRPIWLAWAVVALLFLLVWPTKWPQYTLVARVPLAAMAGLGLERLWDRTRRRLRGSRT